MSKVLVAMSGGVDSSAVCMILQKNGFEVEGVTMRMFDTASNFQKYGSDLPDFIVDAKILADKLNFKHHVLDLREVFKEKVVSYFCGEYLAGRTPNPCVVCNRFVKWKYLADLADQLDCEYISTGHYAEVRDVDGKRYFFCGEDARKDQTYFLWDVPQHILQKTLLPLGQMHKDVVKKIASDSGFEVIAQKKESMEVCFVENDYRDFLRVHCAERLAEIGQGSYVDPEGKKLGLHRGYPFYTVGQRKGLEIALGTPAYVLKINPQKNTVMLGERNLLEASEVLVEKYNIVDKKDFSDADVHTRIRYKSPAQSSEVEFIDENYLVVRFKDKVSAVAPGQSAVFYDGNRLLGGGVIADQRLLKKVKKHAGKLSEE